MVLKGLTKMYALAYYGDNGTTWSDPLYFKKPEGAEAVVFDEEVAEAVSSQLQVREGYIWEVLVMLSGGKPDMSKLKLQHIGWYNDRAEGTPLSPVFTSDGVDPVATFENDGKAKIRHKT